MEKKIVRYAITSKSAICTERLFATWHHSNEGRLASFGAASPLNAATFIRRENAERIMSETKHLINPRVVEITIKVKEVK
ncbi:MAG: hypothetical protein E6Q97_15700 [Desulfurellales bacterium]|nr:MAG: hypothetical protein E6Q97_15700 [Desulfurellales bacterium]